MSTARAALAPTAPLGAAARTPEATLAALFLLLVLTGWVLRPDEYLTPENLQTVAESVAVPMIVALGASLGLLGGVADLSIGSVLGFAATVFAIAFNWHASPWVAGLAALAAGLGVGAINGTVTVICGADAIVATLGALVGVRGLTLVFDKSLSQVAFAPGWMSVVGSRLGPFPSPFLCALAAFMVAGVFMWTTRPGRHVRAIGGNASSAERAGIRAKRIRFGLLLLTSGLASVGGVVYVGQLGAAPSQLGLGLELQVFTGVILGGFSFMRGGLGRPLGALLGVLAIAMLSDLLNILAVSNYWQNIIIGALLLGSVGLDNLRRKEGFQ